MILNKITGFVSFSIPVRKVMHWAMQCFASGAALLCIRGCTMLHRAVHKVFYLVFCLFLIKLDVQIGLSVSVRFICKIPGNVVGWKAEVDSFCKVIIFLWKRAVK